MNEAIDKETSESRPRYFEAQDDLKFNKQETVTHNDNYIDDIDSALYQNFLN